jgi:hypothetical protein
MDGHLRQECSAMGRGLFRGSQHEAAGFERKRPPRGKALPETVSESTPTPRALMVGIV